MRAPTRSHGFDKPSDLEDELAQLDEERADPELNDATTLSARTDAAVHQERRLTIQQQLDALRDEIDIIRHDIEALQANASRGNRNDGDLAAWLPMIRSVAVTSLAGRIFASSPVVAFLVAAVPFAMGLSAGSK